MHFRPRLLWWCGCIHLRMETPLRERSGGHAGTAPTVSFGWVMMCDEKEYNPQGGSLLAYIITQGRLRCTCQPCAIESITPMG